MQSALDWYTIEAEYLSSGATGGSKTYFSKLWFIQINWLDNTCINIDINIMISTITCTKISNNASDITYRSIITKVKEVITSGKVLQLSMSMQGYMKNLIEKWLTRTIFSQKGWQSSRVEGKQEIWVIKRYWVCEPPGIQHYGD